jgi:hypothetical protein
VPCLAHVLTIVGGLAEIGGLALVVVEIIKVQRREFPQHRGWVRRALGWLRRLGRKPETRYVTGAVSLAAVTSAGAGAVVEKPPQTLADRVKRLERLLDELRQLGQQDKAELRQEIAQARETSEAQVAELRAAVEKRDQERRDGLSDALLLQKVGVVAFIVGVGLSVWGNLLPC